MERKQNFPRNVQLYTAQGPRCLVNMQYVCCQSGLLSPFKRRFWITQSWTSEIKNALIVPGSSSDRGTHLQLLLIFLQSMDKFENVGSVMFHAWLVENMTVLLSS